MMRKLRKFVTFGDWGEGSPAPSLFSSWGEGASPNFFIQACQKTNSLLLLRSMGGRRFLSSRGLSVLSPFIRVRGEGTLLGGE